ncbi:hypothetical protein FHR92_003706 [Fontibacillus solani]|uniref:Uncharacterized protein n=2 Tax=Fontibacillus TaxID=995014 RepID=A0A1G7QXN0_9BACL|nr:MULTISPECIES: hypothetical protein [Fontibacillus]MBA9087224.1 hypothetical protein [Fontibacillus solani]SDG03291.1 hypothetical protein SAMN04488542_1249 [Fontibacillus panacisegetis]
MRLFKIATLTSLGLSLAFVGGCQSLSSSPATTQGALSNIPEFTESTLPGGGVAFPHNERIHLSTDQKWIASEGHLSDLIRLQWTAERAKPAIAWADEKGKDKTAIVSHDKANNPEQHDHKHISIETTMSPTGKYKDQLYTRFEIPYDTDVSEIRTHSSNFNVMDGILRVAGGGNRDLQFASTAKENVTSPLWTLRANSSQLTGQNQGADLQIIRYSDKGEVLDSSLTVKRNNGNIGIGTATPESKLDVNGDSIRIRESKTPASSTSPGNKGDIAWDDKYMYVCVAKDTWKRSELSSW